jgi:hypothetical protein
MLKKIRAGLFVRRLKRELASFIATAEAAHEQELAELVSATMLARAYIEELPACHQRFPEAFYSGRYTDAETLAADGFEAQLLGLRNSLMKSGSPNLEAVASGVSVWLFSWYALTDLKFRDDGQRLWQAMEPGIPLARKLLRPIAATVKRDAEQLFFVPVDLLAGYEAMSKTPLVVAAAADKTEQDKVFERR